MKVRRFAVTAVLVTLTLGPACAPDPPVDLDAAWEQAEGVCFTDPRYDGTPPDLRYLGPVDTPANAVMYPSTDGTCSGEPTGPVFILRAAGAEAAAQKCAEWNGTVMQGISRVSDWYPAFPTDAHFCEVAATP